MLGHPWPGTLSMTMIRAANVVPDFAHSFPEMSTLARTVPKSRTLRQTSLCARGREACAFSRCSPPGWRCRRREWQLIFRKAGVF